MSVELRPYGVACNIACRYCYQNPQRSAGNIRQPYDVEEMWAAVRREGGPFTLFGGEPLLMPIAELEALFRRGYQQYGSNGIQTNGILITDEHIRLFKEYRVHVGISVDGPGELNDLRWHISLERTRGNTERTLASIERLCREGLAPGLIITLHRLNAAADRLPRLLDWVRGLDGRGLSSVRLHLLEVESPEIRRDWALTDAENVRALLAFAELQAELKQIRFDVLDDMTNLLLGRPHETACVWNACDPYTTPAVRGVEGNGQSSNCGRTNKDGIDWMKADRMAYDRSIALYRTPQADGGCQGCRFFLMCKGQCPGTAIAGDWRNRSDQCGVWQRLFTHLEERLVAAGAEPLSLSADLGRLEQELLDGWERGRGGGARMAYVDKAQAAAWAPRIAAARRALPRVGVQAVLAGQVRVAVVTVEPADVLAVHNLGARQGLHSYLLPDEGGGSRLAIGSEEAVAEYRRALSGGDWEAAEVLAGVPACCRRAHSARRQAGVADPFWPVGGEQSAVGGDAVIGSLLRPLGLDLLGYQPCSPDCAVTAALGRERLDLCPDEVLAVLGLPAEWSALHGIAELKTGILKLTYSTAYTPGVVAVSARAPA